MQGEGACLGDGFCSRRTREVQSEVDILLSRYFLAEWCPFLEDICGRGRALVEASCLVLTFESPYVLHVELS